MNTAGRRDEASTFRPEQRPDVRAEPEWVFDRREDLERPGSDEDEEDEHPERRWDAPNRTNRSHAGVWPDRSGR